MLSSSDQEEEVSTSSDEEFELRRGHRRKRDRKNYNPEGTWQPCRESIRLPLPHLKLDPGFESSKHADDEALFDIEDTEADSESLVSSGEESEGRLKPKYHKKRKSETDSSDKESISNAGDASYDQDEMALQQAIALSMAGKTLSHIKHQNQGRWIHGHHKLLQPLNTVQCWIWNPWICSPLAPWDYYGSKS